MVVIRIVDNAAGLPCPAAGKFVSRIDLDSHDGRGHVTVTADPKQAIQFATTAAAWSCWRQQSRRQPFRPDGKPNRPLTAFTVEIFTPPGL